MPDTDLRTRIAALEYLVSMLLADHYDVGTIDIVRQVTQGRLAQQSLTKNMDPAQSDHLSAKIAEHVDLVLRVAAEIRAETDASRSE